ncbi:MAG: cation diffusion facilitator family transporter [Cyanobacteria bacterium J06648_16]
MHFHGLDSCNCSTAASPQKLRVLWVALALVATFSSIELRMGHHSHSLSLLADAGHMVADVFAIAMALLAAWIAQWPASDRAPFGYRRVEILAALVNGVGLLLIAGWVAKAAVFQLHAPPTEILTGPMAATAALGLGVNGLNAWLLHGHAGQDLNLRGAFLHVLADAVSCLGVLLGAGAIAWRHWYWVDGAVGVAIALLILLGSIPLLRQSLSILLALTPATVPVDEIRTALLAFDGIEQANRLQVWAIAPGQLCLTATLSVTVSAGAKRDQLLTQLQTRLQQDFGIADTTLQLVSAPALALSTLPDTRIRELI